MKVSVLQDDDFFYQSLELTSDEIRQLYFGSDIDQEFQFDIIGKKDLAINITKQPNEEEEKE